MAERDGGDVGYFPKLCWISSLEWALSTCFLHVVQTLQTLQLRQQTKTTVTTTSWSPQCWSIESNQFPLPMLSFPCPTQLKTIPKTSFPKSSKSRNHNSKIRVLVVLGFITLELSAFSLPKSSSWSSDSSSRSDSSSWEISFIPPWRKNSRVREL